MPKNQEMKIFSNLPKISKHCLRFLGQLAGYTAMVDDLMNTPVENSAIGLLICKEKNAVMARYALSRINAPIGISEYEVAQRQLPHDLQDKLPTEEEIERRLNRIEGSKDTE